MMTTVHVTYDTKLWRIKTRIEPICRKYGYRARIFHGEMGSDVLVHKGGFWIFGKVVLAIHFDGNGVCYGMEFKEFAEEVEKALGSKIEIWI